MLQFRSPLSYALVLLLPWSGLRATKATLVMGMACACWNLRTGMP